MLDYFIAISLRVALVGLTGLLAAALLRRSGAEARHAVWLAVLAGMLMMPLLTLGLPPLPILPDWTATPPTSVPPPPLDLPDVVITLTGAPRPAVQPGLSWPEWSTVALAAYSLVALLLLLRVAWAVRRARALTQSATPVSDEALVRELEQAAALLGVAYPLPEVLASTTVLVPMTADRAILLPADWTGWDSFSLRAVLLHELAHVRRRDWMTSLLAAANRALFWFHPISWWVERRLTGLAEEACDSAAIGATGDARRYAQTVLDFAAVMGRTGSRLDWASTAMARSSRVGQRIERILEGEVNKSRKMTRAAWAALTLAAIPVLYAAAVLNVAKQEVLAMPAVSLPMAAASALSPAPQTAIQVQAQAPPPQVVPYQPDKDLRGAPIPGAIVSSTQVLELEARVKKNPHDLDARAQLAGYYFMNAMAEPFKTNVIWLTEYHPESNVHETYPLTTIDQRNPLLDSASYERLRSIWQRKAAENPANVDVLLHAARFLMFSDRELAERILADARTANPSDERPLRSLVSMYISSLTAPVQSQFHANSQRVLSLLENSRDAELVGNVGSAIRPMEPVAVNGQIPPDALARFEEMNQTRRQLSTKLLERAVALDPQNPQWAQALDDVKSGRMQSIRAIPSSSSSTPASPAAPARISVGGAVQQSMLVDKVDPEYPPLARQARISGTVRFTVIIGKEGDVANVTLVSGHPLLVQSAVAAVKQYRYKPTLLNGQPVEVVTQVDVPFTLQQ